jgi:hypothetical protein
MISWYMFCDRPDRALPTRNITMAVWKIRLRPNWSLIFPYRGVLAVEVSR